MSGDHRFVHVGTPADAGGQQQVAAFDDRHRRHQLVLPGHILDVDLHDPEVRDGGAEMGAHQRSDMAVEIMRCHVDLIGVRHGGDLEGFEDAVPGHVDDGDIDRLLLEIGLELAPSIQ